MAQRTDHFENRLRVTLEESGGVTVVHVSGTVDMSSSPILRKALQGVVRRNGSHTVVDLASVEYMDSSGLATLVEALQIATRRGGRLRLAAPGRDVRFVIELAHLDRLFEIDGSTAESVAALGGNAP